MCDGRRREHRLERGGDEKRENCEDHRYGRRDDGKHPPNAIRDRGWRIGGIQEVEENFSRNIDWQPDTSCVDSELEGGPPPSQ